MGCLFSCFTCCTADPVKAAKWKQQRSASFRKVKDKSNSNNDAPALEYSPVRDSGGGDGPCLRDDTSGVSSEEHDPATRATTEVDGHTKAATGVNGAYDERFEGSAPQEDCESKKNDESATRENEDLNDVQIKNVVIDHFEDETDITPILDNEDDVNEEFDIEQYSDSVQSEVTDDGKVDEASESDVDNPKIYVSEASISFHEDALSTIEESVEKSTNSIIVNEKYLSQLPVNNTVEDQEVLQELSNDSVVEDREVLQQVSANSVIEDQVVPQQSVMSPVPPALLASYEASLSAVSVVDSPVCAGQSTDISELEHESDHFPLSYSQIDMDVVRKIWEYLVPNGDVAQLGVKVLIRVFEDENKRIREIVSSGLSTKFHKSRPILRTEVELTLGRAVLGLLETTNQSLHKEKMDFDVYQTLGTKYYEYGVSYEFGKAIDEVLVEIMKKETGEKFTERENLIWASFCCHVTTNVDVGYTKAKKQKK